MGEVHELVKKFQQHDESQVENSIFLGSEGVRVGSKGNNAERIMLD